MKTNFPHLVKFKFDCLEYSVLCKLLISNSMVSREIWINMHSYVSFSKIENSTRLRTCAILRSLKNSLVHVISKLHSKPCYYLYCIYLYWHALFVQVELPLHLFLIIISEGKFNFSTINTFRRRFRHIDI